MAFNFLALPSELRDMVYERYLSDDLNAPEYFTQQILKMRLPGQPLAQSNQQSRSECISLIFDRMEVTMHLITETDKWLTWLYETVTPEYLAHIRRVVIIGPRICGGVSHNKIIINLNNPNSPVSCGGQTPGVCDSNCKCMRPYLAAAARATTVVRRRLRPGNAIVMTKWKLKRIFGIVAHVRPAPMEVALGETFIKH